MTQQTINLGPGMTDSGKLNSNFSELYSDRYDNAIPKIGFVGDSIMDSLNFRHSNSGLLQATYDQPRLMNFEPNNPGGKAISGSASGSTTPQDLLGAANLSAHLAYGADIEFGLTGGNDNGGADTYTVLNNIQKYVTTLWAAKPSTKFAWHIPTPQNRSNTAPHLIDMRAGLLEMERRDRRFIVVDTSEVMGEIASSFQPVKAGTNVLGGVVETGNGQHPSGYTGWATRGIYDKVLDRLDVPKLTAFPTTYTNDIYNATSLQGGSLLKQAGGSINMGAFGGTQAPFGNPANFQGTISSGWDPIAPTGMVVQGSALSSFTLPSGKSVPAMKIALNTGNATLSAATFTGIARPGMAWPAGVTAARLYGYVYLENVVGISGFMTSGYQFTNQMFLGSPSDGDLSSVWNAGNPITRLMQISIPWDLTSDVATGFSQFMRAYFAAGTTPSGNIYFGNFSIIPRLTAF